MFWPDDAESDARRKFSQNLWRVKQALDPVGYGSLIHVAGDDITIAAGASVEVDVIEFVAGTAATIAPRSEASVRRLLEAVELYKGEFMHGFYEDWVVREQRRTGELYLRALTRLVQALKATGANDEALIYARKLTWQEPLREEAHREVMRLCMLLDRPMEALRQYERLEDDLYRELGVEPEPSTKDLFEAIAERRGVVHSPLMRDDHPPHPAEAPFIGRRVERKRGVDYLEATIAGHGSVVLVEGEPGVGKTRFLQEVADAAVWRGVEVLRGSATAHTTVPFGMIRSALGAGMTALRAEQLVEQVDELWLTEVTRVVPQLAEWLPDLAPAAPLESTEGRDRMIEAITLVMSAFGRITPHLIIFDDLHWADADSIDVIRRMASSTALRRTSIFTAFRGAEGRARADVWQLLRELDRAGASVVTLEPMPAREVEQLVRWAAGEDRTVMAAAPDIMRDTGGNPLFVIETTRALVESGGLVDRETLPMTDGVRGVLADRLRRIDDNEREVVCAMGVRGEAASSDQLFQWCALSRAELLDALDRLVHRRFVVDSDAGYQFVHDQLRRVAYELTLPEERSRFHRVIAETLELDPTTDPAVLAHHLHMAGQRSRAFRYWAGAAREATAIHAYATAAQYFESALGNLDSGDAVEGWTSVLADFEAVLAVLGNRPRQFEILEMWGRADGGPQSQVDQLIRLSAYHAEGDDYPDAIELAGRAARLARSVGVSAHRANLAAGRALHWSGQADAALDRLRSAASEAPHDPEIALALGGVLGQTQRYRDARAQLSEALDGYRRREDKRGEAEALGLLALVAEELGDGAVVQEAFREAIDTCREIGFTRGLAMNQGNFALSQLSLGAVASALELFGEARAAHASIGNTRRRIVAALNEAMVLHQVIGDDATAAELLNECLSFLDGGPSQGTLAHCHEVLAGIAHRRGDTGQAQHHAGTAERIATECGDARRRGYALTARAVMHGENGEFQAGLDDIRRARDGAGPDLTIRLDSIEGWLRAELGDPLAWEMSVRAHQLLRTGISLAWMVAYYHGVVASRMGKESVADDAFLEAWELLDSALAGLDDGHRRSALTNVPVHAAIHAHSLRLQPIELDVRLARSSAPLGRPLTDEEFVEVRWALDRSVLASGTSGRRLGVIELALQAQTQGAVPTVDDLADALSVSRATIKRDLAVLRDEGRAPRTRGSRNA